MNCLLITLWGTRGNAGNQHFFSFSHNVFYPSWNKFHFYTHIYFVICKWFQFGPVWNFVVWKRINRLTSWRPRKTLSHEDNYIITLSRHNRFWSSPQSLLMFEMRLTDESRCNLDFGDGRARVWLQWVKGSLLKMSINTMLTVTFPSATDVNFHL